MSDLETLEKIVQMIAAQEGLRGAMPDEQIEATLTSLRAQEAALRAKVEGSGAIAQGDEAKAVGEGAVDNAEGQVDGSIVTGEVESRLFAGRDLNIIAGEAAEAFIKQFFNDKPPLNLEGAMKRYLAYLANRHRYLKFRGMGVSDRVPLKLPLHEMYIPLKARTEMPGKGDEKGGGFRLAGRELSEEELAAVGQRLSGPRPLIELLAENDGLIILGDPGAGKTTFMKYLALMLALGQGEQLGLGQRLPVLLPLSAYANALAEKDVALHRFIAQYYEDLGIDEPLSAMLGAALDKGGALLLLDGLDEVHSLGRRNLVVDRVLEFFAHRQQQGNKFILTSRIVGYRDVRPSSTDMAECTLVDFDDEEIKLFVERWTAALERQAYADERIAAVEAQRERDELLLALQRNPGVQQLAANPLLLTILALMKRQGVVLPDRRVELYQKYVEILLKYWNLARGLGRPPSRDLDVVETIKVLAPLALWMQETSPGVGLVKREDVRRKLVEICEQRDIEEPDASARRLLEDARQHANLLLERGAGQYGFIHLTFQEYLAAVAIGQQGQKDLQPVVDTLTSHITDDNWHEASLLTIGYLGIIQQRDEAAGDVLMRLIEAAPGEPGQAVVLAGEAVADVGKSGVTATCRRRVIEALLMTMGDDGQVDPKRRAEAGQVLARIGDPRPEVMTVEGMRFCYVPAGLFWLGADNISGDEKPEHELNIDYDYWLGQYPVTNAQFEEFVAAGGYKEQRYWAEAIRHGRWRNGKVKGLLGDDWRERPYNHGYTFTLPNHPVVGVTWYEALAFCRWLTDRLSLPEGYIVALPSEAEWEKGARGGMNIQRGPARVTVDKLEQIELEQPVNPNPKRRYPWGDEIELNRANHDKYMGSTTAVGCYPGHSSPYGCLEMAGNVWEWTRSIHTQYPYNPDDGRENLDEVQGDSGMVLRGGSWYNDTSALRCSYRVRSLPGSDYNLIGFRVVVSPYFSLPSGR